MSENILYEHKIVESEGFDAMMGQVTTGMPGFDGQNSIPDSMGQTGTPPGGVYAAPGASVQQGTVTTDISRQAPFITMAQNTITESLPYMIGFVQPLSASIGYVFGLQQKDKTQIQPSDGNPYPKSNPAGDDIVVLRKLVDTKVREVTLDFTNEASEDIQKLFGDQFKFDYDKFIKSGGEVWDGPNGPLAKFFLTVAKQRMTDKINHDFTTWLSEVATLKGSATIDNWSSMNEIIGVLAELREALFKNTGKSGNYWALVTPRIASFLESTLSSNIKQTTGNQVSNKNRGYVTTIGNIDIYQYDFNLINDNPIVTGGVLDKSETSGEIYMGFTGGPDVSSVYYSPYNEYITQGGENYMTGQSNVYYRVRDAWETNPLDTYDITITTPEVNTPANKSQYIVKANLTFNTTLLS